MSHTEVRPSPLFRPEVTASLSNQWMGSIRLAQQTSSWLIAGVATAISAAFLVFVFSGSITKKAHVTGILTPATGSVGVNAASAGVLVRHLVKEGEQVHAGQTLFELSTERQGSNGELTLLVAQQLASRAQSLDTEQRLRTAQSLEKFETLQASGYVSAAQVQQKQEDLIDLSTRLSALERNQAQLRGSRLDVEAELAAQANSLESDMAQFQRAKALLQQEVAENSNRKSFLVTAPQDGIVTTIISGTYSGAPTVTTATCINGSCTTTSSR